MLRLASARCTRVEAIGHGRVRVKFDSELTLAPGQFALARLAATHDPYLRQMVFPAQIWPDGFALELPAGDPARLHLNPGADIVLLGPAGKRAPQIAAGMNLLLVANARPERLLPLAMQAIGSAGAVTLLLGRPYPVEALHPEIEVRVGHLPTLVAEYVKWAARVYIHTEPQPPNEIVKAMRAAEFDEAQVSVLLTPPMPCGTGACQACAVRMRRGWKLACREGPMFPLTDLSLTD